MNNKIEKGYCACGCGGKTKIAKRTDKRRNILKGEPNKFIFGHYLKNRFGELSPNWKGGRHLDSRGYVTLRDQSHPRSSSGRVKEHIVVAEEKNGGPLPEGAVVHHIDGDKTNNNPNNLVICENESQHRLLHIEKKAEDSCGDKNWRRCRYCKEYDNPNNMITEYRYNKDSIGTRFIHDFCRSKENRLNYIKRIIRNKKEFDIGLDCYGI